METCGSLPSLVSSVKLKVVRGPEGANKVYTLARQGATKRVLFFAGDQIESKEVSSRVLELQDPKRQAALVGCKFPDASVLVVMPSRLEAGFACYDHFLHKTTRTGEPLGHTALGYKATRQMCGLANECLGQHVGHCHVILAGFSKGGVVLNQILEEIAELQGDKDVETSDNERAVELRSQKPVCVSGVDVQGFLRAITELHFLDAGLNSSGAYITDSRTAEKIGRFWRTQRFAVFLHGTPRQWDDSNRPWVCVEKNRCKDELRAHGVTVHEKKYFEGEQPSLLMHFKVLEAFNPRVSELENGFS